MGNTCTGLSDVPKIEGGKEGTLDISQGEVGAMPLRCRVPLLSLLQSAAHDIHKACGHSPDDTIVVTKAELEQARAAHFTKTSIDNLFDTLERCRPHPARQEGRKPRMGASAPAVAAIATTGSAAVPRRS
jgi:hypothetical protein